MSNTTSKEVTSVYTTPEELIKSPDFIRWVEIILSQIKTFDKDYILWLFKKLQSEGGVNDEEKEELLKILSDEKIAGFGQELLSKLKGVNVSVKINNSSELASFSELLNNIFSEDWYKKVSRYVGVVANIAKLTLNTYEWMDKITLTLANWKIKEIHIQRKFLKLSDDSILKYTLLNWALSNFPDIEIKDNPLLITKNKYWDYHFWHTAIVEEAKKLWMRLPTDEEMGSPEFNKYVVENTTEFPGYRFTNGSVFWDREDFSFFWGAFTDWAKASSMVFNRGDYEADRYRGNKSTGLPVRLVKD